jgi:hypothetical protein
MLHAQYFAHLTAGSTWNGLEVILLMHLKTKVQYFTHRKAGSTFAFST